MVAASKPNGHGAGSPAVPRREPSKRHFGWRHRNLAATLPESVDVDRAACTGGSVSDDYGALARAWQAGDIRSGAELFSALDRELRVIAAARLRREPNCSLSCGDLVNEAYIKLASLRVIELQSRGHILALASRMMRQVLIDAARKRSAAKREGEVITLCTNIAQWELPVDVLSLDEILTELAKVDLQRAQIVEMRFFGGMTTAEIAEVLGISEPTVKRRWAATRAWLHKRLVRGA